VVLVKKINCFTNTTPYLDSSVKWIHFSVPFFLTSLKVPDFNPAAREPARVEGRVRLHPYLRPC